MVFLRLTVKIFPRAQVHAPAGSVPPAVFLLPIENPEEVTLGGLVGLIQQKWSYLHPDLESLAIKRILDDTNEDTELYPDLTVADVWVDHGKARADGHDQRGAVRVIQKPANAAPERFPSVVQDWDTPAVAFYRSREAREKRVSPIQEEEEEDKPTGDDVGPQSDSQRNSFPTKNAFQHNRPLSSIEFDPEDLARLPTTQLSISIAGTPPPKGGSEELGESPPPSLPPWTTSFSQPQPKSASLAHSSLPERRAATPGTRVISLLPHERKSSNSESSPAPSLAHPSLSQPKVFALSDSDSDSDSDSESSDNAEEKAEAKVSEKQSDEGEPSTSPDSGVSASNPRRASQRLKANDSTRKRKQSIDESGPIKQARMEQEHPSTREIPRPASPEVEIIQVSPCPKSKSPAPTIWKSPTNKNPRIPRPPSFCSPERKRNWEKEMARRSSNQHMGQGIGLGITKTLAGNPESQKAARSLSTEASNRDSSNGSPTAAKHTPAPDSLQKQASAIGKESPAACSLITDAHQVQPSKRAIDAVYPSESSHRKPEAPRKLLKDGGKVEIDQATMKQRETEEKARLEAIITRELVPQDVKKIAIAMRSKLNRLSKVSRVQRTKLQAELEELRQKLKAAESKGETSEPTSAKPTPAKAISAKPTPAKPTPAKPTPAKPTPAKPTPVKDTPVKDTPASTISPQPATQEPLSQLKRLLASQKEEEAAKKRKAAEIASSARSTLPPTTDGNESVDGGYSSDSESESDTDSESGDIMYDGRSVQKKKPLGLGKK